MEKSICRPERENGLKSGQVKFLGKRQRLYYGPARKKKSNTGNVVNVIGSNPSQPSMIQGDADVCIASSARPFFTPLML